LLTYLEGFTEFCNQIDPHLVIPEYLHEFLSWLFESISSDFLQKNEGDEAVLWCQLPFFAKFMGDGVLFLWDTRYQGYGGIGNTVLALHDICDKYTTSFLPMIRQRVIKPPLKLRCGIARGQIISIGEGRDFVGPCINAASRLQKIGPFSFAFSKRGFNLQRNFHEKKQSNFILVKSPIRGIGEEELFFVRKKEFDALPDEDKENLLA
jgi:class 3 adenylate cyclase